MGPAFAAPGVALKARAENAIAAAIAAIEILFIFGFQHCCPSTLNGESQPRMRL
jgi:hypothetical protein